MNINSLRKKLKSLTTKSDKLNKQIAYMLDNRPVDFNLLEKLWIQRDNLYQQIINIDQQLVAKQWKLMFDPKYHVTDIMRRYKK